MRDCNKQLQLADNSSIRVSKIGHMPIKVRCKNGLWHAIEFQHVLYAPTIDGTIFSINKMRLYKHDIVFSDPSYLKLNASNPTFLATDIVLEESRDEELFHLPF